MQNTEELVARRAVEVYRKIVEDNLVIERLLETKKYKLNDYVIRKSDTYFDGVFGINEDKVGKIVGYDKYYKWYRIRYDKDNDYIGAREDQLELYDGDIENISEDLLNYDPNEVTYIHGFKL